MKLVQEAGPELSRAECALTRTKALFILPTCVVPPESGPAHLSAGILRAAAAHMHCDVVGFAADEAERERWRQLERAIPGVVVLQLFDRARSMHRLVGRIRRGLLGRPISMATYDNPALHKWLRAESPRRRWDLVHIDTFNLAEYRADVGTIPTVLVPHDAYSLGAWRGAAAASRLLDRLRFRLKAWSYQRFEMGEYRHFAVVAPVAEADVRWLSRLDPRMRLGLVQFPLGSEYFPTPDRRSGSETGIVISGFFANPAVEAGLVEFLSEVYPAIHHRLPSARFTVWGRLGSKATVRSLLRGFPEIHHVDYVPDYLSFLQSFDIFVYPQRYGAGVQTKVQHAMAVGIPVVTRPETLTSLQAQHGSHGFAHQDNHAFAESVITLALDASLRQSVGKEASGLIRRNSSPGRVWESLCNIYQTALSPSAERGRVQRADGGSACGRMSP